MSTHAPRRFVGSSYIHSESDAYRSNSWNNLFLPDQRFVPFLSMKLHHLHGDTIQLLSDFLCNGVKRTFSEEQ